MGLGQGFSRVGSFLFAALREAREHSLSTMAAALAFFALFALPPLLVAVLLVGSEVWGEEEAQSGLLAAVEDNFGTTARETVAGILEDAPAIGGHMVFSQIVSLLVFLYAAVAGFGHLQNSFNSIFGVPRRSGLKSWFFRYVKRLGTFVFVLLICLILVAAVSAGFVIRAFPEEIGRVLPGKLGPFVVQVLEVMILIVLVSIVLTLLYKVVPDPYVPWHAAMKGGVLAAVLQVLARYPFGLYLDYSWRGTVFGAASTLVIALVAFFVGAFLLLLGCAAAHVAARPPKGKLGPTSGGPGASGSTEGVPEPVPG